MEIMENNEQTARINALKQLLNNTNDVAIKHSEGYISASDYSKIKLQRQAWREELTALEGELPLDERKQSAIVQTKDWLSNVLAKNPLEYNGKLYTITDEKQNLLNRQITTGVLKLLDGTPIEDITLIGRTLTCAR